MKTTNEQRDELRRLIREIGDGSSCEWVKNPLPVMFGYTTVMDGNIAVCHMFREEYADYIASVNPDAVTSLLDDIEKSEEEMKNWREALSAANEALAIQTSRADKLGEALTTFFDVAPEDVLAANLCIAAADDEDVALIKSLSTDSERGGMAEAIFESVHTAASKMGVGGLKKTSFFAKNERLFTRLDESAATAIYLLSFWDTDDGRGREEWALDLGKAARLSVLSQLKAAGYQVVPITPTWDMIRATKDIPDAMQCWSAMLTASPDLDASP